MVGLLFSDIILNMLQKKLLLISVATFLFIAFFHFFALKYNWYWTVRWIDIPAHLVGGFWVSVTALLVALKIRHIDKINDYRKKAVLVMLCSVLFVAIFWEIFELIFKFTSLHNAGYWKDTLSDVFNTFVGGVIGLLYFIKNKKTENLMANKNIAHDFVVIL